MHQPTSRLGEREREVAALSCAEERHPVGHVGDQLRQLGRLVLRGPKARDLQKRRLGVEQVEPLAVLREVGRDARDGQLLLRPELVPVLDAPRPIERAVQHGEQQPSEYERLGRDVPRQPDQLMGPLECAQNAQLGDGAVASPAGDPWVVDQVVRARLRRCHTSPFVDGALPAHPMSAG